MNAPHTVSRRTGKCLVCDRQISTPTRKIGPRQAEQASHDVEMVRAWAQMAATDLEAAETDGLLSAQNLDRLDAIIAKAQDTRDRLARTTRLADGTYEWGQGRYTCPGPLHITLMDDGDDPTFVIYDGPLGAVSEYVVSGRYTGTDGDENAITVRVLGDEVEVIR